MKQIGYRIAMQPGDGTYYNVFVFNSGIVAVHAGDYGPGPCASFGGSVLNTQYNPVTGLFVNYIASLTQEMPIDTILSKWGEHIEEFRTRFFELTHLKATNTTLYPENTLPIISNDERLGGYYKGRGGAYLVAFLPLERQDVRTGVISYSVVGAGKYDIQRSLSESPYVDGAASVILESIFDRTGAEEAMRRL